MLVQRRMPCYQVNLSIGDQAPLFTLPGIPEGNEIVLGNVLSEQPVRLAFYPKAFTGG